MTTPSRITEYTITTRDIKLLQAQSTVHAHRCTCGRQAASIEGRASGRCVANQLCSAGRSSCQHKLLPRTAPTEIAKPSKNISTSSKTTEHTITTHKTYDRQLLHAQSTCGRQAASMDGRASARRVAIQLCSATSSSAYTGYEVLGFHFTESVYKLALQKSIPAHIRKLIHYCY